MPLCSLCFGLRVSSKSVQSVAFRQPRVTGIDRLHVGELSLFPSFLRPYPDSCRELSLCRRTPSYSPGNSPAKGSACQLRGKRFRLSAASSWVVGAVGGAFSFPLVALSDFLCFFRDVVYTWWTRVRETHGGAVHGVLSCCVSALCFLFNQPLSSFC
ncbi:hypothetical protein CSUI_001411 [Cystoisospora suis]|uniref:Uncharacterized protein n=1 Tax=Cystoisospora suis TaxID=483139 RepID=A0A2C6LCG6_9APIC|nr:hypothetical protein CSUI_001411 [Cystoisospora suis]